MPRQAVTFLLGTLSSIPDLTILILRIPNPYSPNTFSIVLNSPRWSQPIPDTFSFDPKLSDWLTAQYEYFSKAGRGTVIQLDGSSPTMSKKDRNIIRLEGFGKEIYDKLAPSAFKRAFWRLHDELGAEFDSIHILTDTPLLPWELMRPTRDDGSGEQDFLGMNFRLARWHVSWNTAPLASPPQTIEMNELLVIAPRYESRRILPNVAAEVAILQKIPGFRRFRGGFDALRTLVNTAALKEGMIHFAGHGMVKESTPGVMVYTIQLEDGELDWMTWRGLFSGKIDVHPFIFFNACDVGQAHHMANFVDGWAPTVLESGASGYIGGLWPLGDRGACEFAKYFYTQFAEELQAGAVTIADVLRDTRKQFYENGDPTFLGYVYYGDPDFRLTQDQ
jgi:hypothetical protein